MTADLLYAHPTVTISAEWLRSVLKKAKTAWPKDLKEDTPIEICKHAWSEHSNPVFCKLCGGVKD